VVTDSSLASVDEGSSCSWKGCCCRVKWEGVLLVCKAATHLYAKAGLASLAFGQQVAHKYWQKKY